MTDARILYPQFRDEQAESKYPFSDSASLRTAGGTFTISNDTFIDAVFYPIGAVGRVYISSIEITAQTVTFNVGDQNTLILLTGSYDLLNPPTNGFVQFFDGYGRSGGALLSTPLKLAIFSTLPVGTYVFSSTATEFVAGVVLPANEPGVRGLRADTDELLTGDIWLVGDQGIVVRPDSAPGVIRIDIIGEPLFKRFVCEPLGSFKPKKFLKTINGRGPDEYGNFTITATDQNVDNAVLRIYPQNGTIVVDTVGRSIK